MSRYRFVAGRQRGAYAVYAREELLGHIKKVTHQKGTATSPVAWIPEFVTDTAPRAAVATRELAGDLLWELHRQWLNACLSG